MELRSLKASLWMHFMRFEFNKLKVLRNEKMKYMCTSILQFICILTEVVVMSVRERYLRRDELFCFHTKLYES